MSYKNVLINFVFLVGVATTSHCAYINQPGIKIKVVDKDTKQPITTAIVSNQYDVSVFPAGYNCYGKSRLKTDRNGEVSIGRYFRITWPLELYDCQGIYIRVVGYIPVSVSVGERGHNYDFKASYLVSKIDSLDNEGKKVLEYYEQFYKQKFKYFYKIPKHSDFKIMVPEKRMVIRGDDGTIEEIALDKPLNYIEIPMGKIKDEKKYIKIMRYAGTDYLFEVENIKEFLRQYPNSKEKYSLLQWTGAIYKRYLNDQDNAMKYYSTLIKEGNEYLAKHQQKSKDRLNVIYTLQSVSWEELKDYDMALMYSEMAKEEITGDTKAIEQDIKTLKNLIKTRNSKNENK